MNKLIQAADDARRLLKGFAGIAEVAAAFEEVGKLQQARDEAERALPVLRKQAVDAQAQVDEAKAKATDIQARADAYSQEVIEGARSAAMRITDEAKAKADKIGADAAKKMQDAEASVAAAIDRVQALELDLKAKADEYADLERKVAKLREQAAKVLG